LSETQSVTDPAAAAAAARTAAGHLRRVGDRLTLAYSILNLFSALLLLGDWNTAEEAVVQAIDADGLADIEQLTCCRGWLAALRGDAETADAVLAALRDLRTTEDLQDRAIIQTVEAFTAAARGQRSEALRHARRIFAKADVLGISSETLRWAWPLAVRTAHELGDASATGKLLAMLDSDQPGHVAPMLRAERALARARIADDHGDPSAGPALAAAITDLRERSTPYHLAHGLLDHAEHLLHRHDTVASASAVREAREIARRLGCQLLLDRANAIEPAEPRMRT
jgi:hypothetical protein